MYLLVISFKNGDVLYFGPFPTAERATRYGREAEIDYIGQEEKIARWFVCPITVPYSVVQQIKWRE